MKRKCYVVVDTNVLVSALLSKHKDAATVQVFHRLFDEDVCLLYSEATMGEYIDVLSRPKFHFSESDVIRLLSQIRQAGILLNPKHSDVILPDMKDLPFYELVLEKKEDPAYLVTGNSKHFPKEPFVVTPKELIDILGEE